VALLILLWVPLLIFSSSATLPDPCTDLTRLSGLRDDDWTQQVWLILSARTSLLQSEAQATLICQCHGVIE
jgi:hypothetical protein